MAKKIAIANHKGGVGKTTLAVNLAATASQRDNSQGEKNRVLIIDLDQQGNTSQYLGRDISTRLDDEGQPGPEFEKDLWQVMESGAALLDVAFPYNLKIWKDKGPKKNKNGNAEEEANIFYFEDIDDKTGELIQRPYQVKPIENLLVVPAPERLNWMGFPEDFMVRLDTDFLVRKVADIEDKFDYIFFDCPPQISRLTISALRAADAMVLPINPGNFELFGIRNLLSVIKGLREQHQMANLGMVVMNKYRPTIPRHQHYYQMAGTHFSNFLAKKILNFSDTVTLSSKESCPFVFNPKTKDMALAFNILFNELNDRMAAKSQVKQEAEL